MRILYSTSWRWKIKKLPLRPHKKEGNDIVTILKMLSRRFLIKCMVIGAVGRSISHRNFDAKILLERVSETMTVSKIESVPYFCDNVIINQQINSGDWHTLVTDNSHLLFEDILTTITNTNGIDGLCDGKLKLSYELYIGKGGKKGLLSKKVSLIFLI